MSELEGSMGAGVRSGRDATPPDLQRSTRDWSALHADLERWLAAQLPPDAGLRLGQVTVPETNGMSSETILFDASWDEGGTHHDEALVARVAPQPSAVPVFPTYDLERQARVMRAVRDASTVPVPRVFWSEPGDHVVGGAFFVMERVDGQVPPDVMPYNFGSWVTEATPEQRAHLQERSIAVLADLHSIENPERRFDFLQSSAPGDTALRRHVNEQQAFYDWARGDLRLPLIERAFAWLDDHWPADEGPTVLSWGDARIGNTMYRNFEPVAVFDWEMAGLAPREVDLAWFIYLHRFFEDLAATFEVPGLPDFLRPDDVLSTYESASGHIPRDLDFYTVYSLVRFAIVSIRTTQRQIHFGEAEVPADPDDLIMHRQGLEALLAGTYW